MNCHLIMYMHIKRIYNNSLINLSYSFSSIEPLDFINSVHSFNESIVIEIRSNSFLMSIKSFNSSPVILPSTVISINLFLFDQRS